MASTRPATASQPDQGAGRAPAFSVLARRTLPEEVANRLLEQIRAQQLRPGDKLPSERDLAGMMAVSRPVVREALRALALMRVVDIRQGDGTYVASLEPRQLVSHLDFVFPKDGVALAQLLEARRIVEPVQARLAAVRASDDQLAELDDLVRTLGAAVDDPDRFAELDIALHVAVGAAAGNFLLVQFMHIVSTLGRVSREQTGARRSVRDTTLRDHRRLARALRARDPEAAERAMLTHLDHVAASLRAVLAGGVSGASGPGEADGAGA